MLRACWLIGAYFLAVSSHKWDQHLRYVSNIDKSGKKLVTVLGSQDSRP